MQLLAGLGRINPMNRLWNFIVVCDTLGCLIIKQQNVNRLSLILSFTDKNLILCKFHASKLVNCLTNLWDRNAALLIAVHYQSLSGI